MTKICVICKKEFDANIHNKKICSAECKKQYGIEYNKKYHDEYYQKNSEYVKAKVKEYRENNVEEYRNQKRKYRKNNLLKERARNKRTKDRRFKNDIHYKIKETMSRRIFMALKNQSTEKSIKTINLIGCSIEECRNHIEKQFKFGMSWENWGIHGWHIDHIKPCASFDLTKEEEQLKCFHYTNLQPLWALENIRKGDKIL